MNILSTSIAILLALGFSSSVRAEEQTMNVRVIGISDASRIEDFHKTIKNTPEIQIVSLDSDKAIATLRYDVPTLLAKPKPRPDDMTPEKILKQMDTLIGKASNRTFSVTKPTGIAEDKLRKIAINVGVLDCKGCRYGAYIAIANLEGVERATVNSDSRILTVWIDPAQTNQLALETALKKARVEIPSN